MYNDHIEGHSFNFRQHMAMLSADICALDHSHKVMLMLLCDSCIAFSSLSCQITKHLAIIDGEQIFTGLLSLTNELGQIRACNLVATKSHSQFELSMNSIQKLLDLYGHSHPQLIYTDTMANKQFLERCFLLLRKNVIPVEKHDHLEPFELSDAFWTNIFVKNTASSINDAICTILEDVPEDKGCVVVGFDSEWNVELAPN